MAELRDEKDNRPLPHQIRRPRLTTREKNPQKHQATEKLFRQKGAEFRADTEIAVTHWMQIAIFDTLRQMRSPAKGQRNYKIGLCISRFCEEGKLGSNHTVKFSKGTWHQITIRDRMGPSRGVIQKCEPHERSPCAPKFGERAHEETLHQERCARKAAWDLAKIFQAQAKVMSTPIASTRPEEREFVVDSGALMHMMSKKELGSEEMVDCHWEEHTHEEAQVFVHDLDLFVTVQILEETPAALSLGKLCEDQDTPVGQRSKATIDQRWEEYYLQDGRLRTSCRSRVVHQF